MKKRTTSKLRLDKETLRRLEQLQSPELEGVAGGATRFGCGSSLCSDSVCNGPCP